jgi:hypothetical protein
MSKEIIYRATLAPGKANGDWTVGDLRKFVLECSQQSIPDETPLTRDVNGDFYGNPGHFRAERTVEL